jgi:hypothetical protein
MMVMMKDDDGSEHDCVVLLLYAPTGAVYLQAKCNTVTGIERKSQCKISDYTVEVHNIPHDTVDSDLLKVCM